MANTYKLIEAKTLTTTTASVTFTSIPQTYTDLQLAFSVRGSGSENGDSLLVYFNTLTTNMTSREARGMGTATATYTRSNTVFGYANDNPTTANTFTSGQLYIPNYTSSNYKSQFGEICMENNDVFGALVMATRLWSSSAAITDITLDPEFGSFVANSSFYLYGIKNS